MRVFVLGGYGNVGLPTVRLLVQSDLVTTVAVAGRSLTSARQVCARVGPKAEAVRADGVDEQQLAALFDGSDIVVNAATQKAVLPAIRAAGRVGANYCDVASFGDFVEEVLPLTAQVKEAGITAVIANGFHPAMSNLMGVHVAAQLDEVEQVQLGDASVYNYGMASELSPWQWQEDPERSLAILSEFRGFLVPMLKRARELGGRPTRVRVDRRWDDANPVTCGVDAPLVNGSVGKRSPYMSGAPLFGSLPGDLGTAPPVEMSFTPFPLGLHELLRDCSMSVSEGKTDPESGIDFLLETVGKDPEHWLRAADSFVPTQKMWARAVGQKGGRGACSSCWLTPEMWDVGGYYLTSVALAVATLKMLRGEIDGPGVVTAERAFGPLAFFRETAAILPVPPKEGSLVHESFQWLDDPE